MNKLIDLQKVLNEHELWLKSKGGQRANLRNANFRNADLRGANFRNADLRGANLEGVDYSDTIINLQCPEEGSFIGFKKVIGGIAKLLITEDSLRSSATSRKCRASKVVVLEIKTFGGRDLLSAKSKYDNGFIYTVGETIEIEDFNKDRFVECTSGIHFFITRREAELY